MRPQCRFLRSELYELVWSKPVTKVAAEVGVSDVAVAKSCRAEGIPLPPRGSWARRQHGHSVQRPPLPALPGGKDPFIVFRPVARATADGPASPPKPPVEPVPVRDDVRRLHPAIRRLRTILREGTKDSQGLLQPRNDVHCMVMVTPQQLDRACRILQALLAAFAARGYEIVEDPSTPALSIRVALEVYTFIVVERFKELPIEPGERLREHEYADRGWSIPPYRERRASGGFDLRIIGRRGTLVRWGDRAGSPLEQRLHEVVSEVERLVSTR